MTYQYAVGECANIFRKVNFRRITRKEAIPCAGTTDVSHQTLLLHVAQTEFFRHVIRRGFSTCDDRLVGMWCTKTAAMMSRSARCLHRPGRRGLGKQADSELISALSVLGMFRGYCELFRVTAAAFGLGGFANKCPSPKYTGPRFYTLMTSEYTASLYKAAIELVVGFGALPSWWSCNSCPRTAVTDYVLWRSRIKSFHTRINWRVGSHYCFCDV